MPWVLSRKSGHVGGSCRTPPPKNGAGADPEPKITEQRGEVRFLPSALLAQIKREYWYNGSTETQDRVSQRRRGCPRVGTSRPAWMGLPAAWFSRGVPAVAGGWIRWFLRSLPPQTSL